MNAVIEVLYLRRPRLEYISPPVCEFDFSSSGGPVVVLDALGRILAPSGFVLGGRGRFTLSWNNYPGALCYTVYKAVDSNNPFGEYVVVAECIEDPMINLEPEGEGCYRVSAITENGESELSDPICEVGHCPFITSGANPPNQVVNAGDTIALSTTIHNQGLANSYHWFKDGVFSYDTTGTTQEILEITPAAPEHSGTYVLIINEGDACEDDSDPATVTVNQGPPCTPFIEPIGFINAADMGSDGTVIGNNDANTRPFYHRNHISKDIRTEVDSSPVTATQVLTTVTASVDFFTASDVNKVIVFSTSEEAQITAFISPLQVTVTPSQSVPSTTFVLRGNTLGGATGQGIVANGSGILAGLEDVFGVSSLHVFWLDLNNNTIRDLGANRQPVALAEDGFLLLYDQTNPADTVSFLYDPGAQTFTNLGDTAGGQTTARAMNDSHVVAVDCTTGPGSPVTHAHRWIAGVLTDIHPAEAGAESSFTVGINDSGDIAGIYFDPTTFDTRTFVNFGGASIDIGTITGYIEAETIGNDGTVIGTVDNAGDFVPFFWTQGSGIQTIPLLAGTVDGTARGINSDGWIVGEMSNVAFLYRDGVTHRLIDLIPGGTLWTTLFLADSINDDGFITGIGIYDGNLTRFLLQLC